MSHARSSWLHMTTTQDKWLTQRTLKDVGIILTVLFSNSWYGLCSWALFCEMALRWMLQNTLDDKSILVQVVVWYCLATSHYLSQCGFRSMLPYGITMSQLVKSLQPSDAVWRQRSWSTLAQVMACCLTAPSHYLNQCWLIISEVQWQSPEGTSTNH